MKLTEKFEFEIHITVNPRASVDADIFTKICRELGGKALLIELAKGKNSQQLMMSKCVSENNPDRVLAVCKNDCENFALKDFVPNRIKIEVNSNLAEFFEDKNRQNYFEWHGKIKLKFPEQLLKICENHNVHFSKNSLKGESELRFITLREYGKKSAFEKRVGLLIKDLQKNGWEILKQESEFCIFDSNISLDEGWMGN